MVEAELSSGSARMPAAGIDDPDYLRQRISPRCGDPLYLHLSDLLLALSETASTAQPIVMLDYGCGGSPYRPLFTNARYLRADVPGTTNVDYEIGPDGLVTAAAGSFDLVLSTQVLEHLPDAARYLRSCFDLLRPGGRLVLSTHGTFEDHPCPEDFYRWTADGLRKDVAAAGFAAVKVQKLTSDARALAFLLRTKLHLLCQRRSGGFGLLFRVVNRVVYRMAAHFDRWCDRHFQACRVVGAGQPGHAMYIALVVVAERPR